MVVLGALLTLTLILQTAVTSPDEHTFYLVTFTSQTVGGNREILCAQLHEPKEPVSFRVSLTVAPEIEEILLEESVTDHFHECVPFQVPVVSRDTVAHISVTVKGDTVDLNKNSTMLIQPSQELTMIRTDKPIYKPGQTIQFRVVSLDTSFLPHNQMYKMVELQDPDNNRIAQWLNRSTVSGILDLSHPMPSDATQGIYIITAWNEKNLQTTHSFEIKEYVLPKYEVTIHLPKVITILDTEVPLKVCAKYTYGKPVQGSVKATVCRKSFQHYWLMSSPSFQDICKEYSMTTDKTGCASHMVDVTEFALNRTRYQDRFHVESEVEEFGTGVIMKGQDSTRFTTQIVSMAFEDAPHAYRPGIPYEGKIKVTGPDSAPFRDTPVHLFVRYQSHEENLTLTTDGYGFASFSLDTVSWGKNDVRLQAQYQKTEEMVHDYDYHRPSYGTASHFVQPFHSKSNSFLKFKQVSEKLPCEEDGTVTAHYIIQGKELRKKQQSLDFYYLVLSKGSMIQHGQFSVAVRDGRANKGDLSLSLNNMQKLSPYAQVVMYTVLPRGEVVADSMDVPIDLCFANKVSLKFSAPEELPGEETSLNLRAYPGSLCSLRAVDQSVLLLKPDDELSEDSVFRMLPVQRLSGYPYKVDDEDSQPCVPRRPSILARPAPPRPVTDRISPLTRTLPTLSPPPRRRQMKRSLYFGPPHEKVDVHSIFKEIGVKIITNSDVKKPVACRFRDHMFFSRASGIAEEAIPMAFATDVADDVGARGAAAPEEPVKTIRTYFPETWIWDLITVDNSGSVDVVKKVPDTITKWEAGAFCMSPVGFGLAPNVGLTAFQPFFVSLTLPYSVVRGEVFALKATVFNYLSKCITVKVTLADSEQFTAQPFEGMEYTHCLCAEESKTFKWILTPTALGEVSLEVTAESIKTEDHCGNEVAVVPERGRIDTVVRKLLVEAEGTKQTMSHNELLCLTDGPVERDVSLKLPDVFVEGSAKASFSVLGDLMGRALRNLDRLLAMPFGCGEQNMVLFAPNIYIMQYLESSGQLTQEIKSRAKRFLESGYQRELKYKHDDGSYSAFGKSDASGNTWLTAFVMKSFGGARPYVYVNSEDIDQAKAWLGRMQQKDGCFASVGKLLNNAMKGGISDEVSLTAYITAALLELDIERKDPMVEKAFGCLKYAVDQQESTYLTALLAYTYTLAGDEETRAELLTRLDKLAISRGGERHWRGREDHGKGTDSLEVEMTAYVLLALLSGPERPEFGLGYSASIVRWLAKQQNPFGGFASTQDTVVALQALAKYSAATFSPEGASMVTLISPGGLEYEFSVDQHNRLLYQETQLQEVPGTYQIKADGKGCVFAQLALHYNIPPPPDYTAFNISTSTVCNNTKQPSITVSVHVRYNGRREETNMVIINVKLLSGFLLDEESLRPLRSDPTVKRVDQEDGHVIIYLDELKRMETKTYNLVIKEDVAVRNLKPAVVKVYDYYQTSDEAVSEYMSPCAESDDVNEL
ncbi:alpha-2-macroglobulin [Chanos chanos]|uniref:Alpha-2-macroglobulin n=1 Tax=Chanos chanos TaxID=29144 RepID=A0A6J2VJF8_CHACN|nr:alpha-2-macroglobulin-like [Chanos chanos]